ncbi:DNA repair protein RadA [Brevibacillus laterosporus]|uniref:DNA repair protein RadA n=1 Tax=Brevibacillus laterosporus TaxID=1465 RepID=A0AAP8QA29_BRELA|nr:MULTISPECIES: DNA repair protein RadA [Brevibacillus]ATO49535.1 DNA repair protein RadA [Brevibacillus laterosporus DSM 25]MBG9772203.1 DNA repair protein RadA [Brevibacillus laterosporus]MCG7319980.1 DNA repair protein RadA [Brevibacillus laterosporus]MCR8982145.1 DNA repair protein RadA [Brevibacillus laterosporus]MCZ0809299.1 DNA repair protein RadA [Brevibacillus laterosporus]
MSKVKTKFVCQDCGYESPKWMGKCPGCNNWNTLVEELERKQVGGRERGMSTKQKAQPITEVISDEEPRLDTTLGELNRVLGGGLVLGSLVLVGGDPGIGKSTLLLQTSFALAHQNNKVLYISGEESVKQIKMRADRLGVQTSNLLVVTETDLEQVEEQITFVDPDVVIIDSIQTIFHPAVTSAAGSVAQVRECTSHLMRIAKSKGIAIFIVGHVTKEGAIAGPRMLEHMVDAVLYFEGDRHNTFRILRAVKNRFGSTNEMGIFEMKEKGLTEVENPSELFLAERPIGVAGSTVVASMEGTRPVLVELQALVSPTSFATPRRMATGVDHQRIAMIMAVLEKRVGLMLQNQDAYVNVAGGVRLDEPAIDLAIAVSIASSFRDHSTNPYDVVIGEIGLTGEVRGVSRIEQRIREAEKLGFKRVIIPERSMRGLEKPSGIEVIGVKNVEEALEYALRG